MSRSTIRILVVTFITVIIWIIAEVYHSTTTSTLDPQYSNIVPISDNLDETVLDDVDARQSYNLYDPFEIQ